MKYLLFISFNTGLLHNNIYNSLNDLCESLMQLAEDEGLDVKAEEIPTFHNLRNYLREEDDYVGRFTNNTWYHIQSNPVFGA